MRPDNESIPGRNDLAEFDFEAAFYALARKFDTLAMVAASDISPSVLQGAVIAANREARELFALASGQTATEYLRALRGMSAPINPVNQHTGD